MKEYTFEELGYFTERECQAIKDSLQGHSYMDFDIVWSNQAGNCILILRTDYRDTSENIKNFFLHCIISQIVKERNK